MITNMKQQQGFDHAPVPIASCDMMWCVAYLKKVADEETRLCIDKKSIIHSAKNELR